MAIITLTSDWGIADYYAAAVKGAILTRCPQATIVDINHNIPKFSLAETAVNVKNVFRNFPAESIHIIGVNSESSIETPHIIAYYDKHYFIGSDNGVFSLIFDHAPEKIWEINVPQDSDYFTFPSRDVFAKVACMIINKTPFEKIGTPLKELKRLTNYLAVPETDTIKGIVTYIDNYDNAFINITEKMFKEVGGGRKFKIIYRSEEFYNIHKAYGDVGNGDIVFLFNSSGVLEIAINKGSAHKLLGIKLYDQVRIEFATI